MYLKKSVKKEKLEALRKLVRDTDSPIIVEGLKDKRVLSSLGFKNIYTISGRAPETIAKLVSLDEPRSVIILTDFDREGRKHFKRLVKFFHSHGIKVDTFLRRKIKSIAAIHKIEELASFNDNSGQFTFA